MGWSLEHTGSGRACIKMQAVLSLLSSHVGTMNALCMRAGCLQRFSCFSPLCWRMTSLLFFTDTLPLPKKEWRDACTYKAACSTASQIFAVLCRRGRGGERAEDEGARTRSKTLSQGMWWGSWRKKKKNIPGQRAVQRVVHRRHCDGHGWVWGKGSRGGGLLLL